MKNIFQYIIEQLGNQLEVLTSEQIIQAQNISSYIEILKEIQEESQKDYKSAGLMLKQLCAEDAGLKDLLEKSLKAYLKENNIDITNKNRSIDNIEYSVGIALGIYNS